LWKEIATLFGKSKKPLGGKLDTTHLAHAPNWFVMGFTADEYDQDRFQGHHAPHVLVIVDEASGVSENIYLGIDGVLAAGNTHLLSIGNPTRRNSHFARTFETNGVSKFHVSAFDTPNFTTFGITVEDIASGEWKNKIGDNELPAPHLVSPAWVADKYFKWGPTHPFWFARVLGKFPLADENALIDLAWIEEAQNRTLEADNSDVVLGVDVAREGDDESAGYVRRGAVLRQAFVSKKEHTTSTTGRALRAMDEEKADRACVDVVGVGAGVFDSLNEQRPGKAHAVNFGEAATDSKRFANLKAELYWKFRVEAEAGNLDLDPEDEAFAAQATSVRWLVDSKGRILIEKKEDMKKRGLPSPDRFEAGVYTYYSPPPKSVSNFVLV
jgi:hypothetical protein